ncbi:deoxyribose-phosphate aldolase [Pelagicoccus mobilis]|uniref:Deoxyribose-phosphate aldolase n=1 Tax=Pelagicoccus mobilis TaxID=415221 RepID=A0A934S185_9BACT|nr:deoxyribose-phosphate aldolase [Pelagicoccus mobilis]MBK1878731.1 deoxyribose-phosphate aldolase [Pelagicoccus mobilis]
MKHSINRYLDHAVLKPEMSNNEAAEAIELGVKYAVRTVCVRPSDIELAKELCSGSETEVCTVLSFPHGICTTESKVAEAKDFIAKSVHEVDMVANYGRIRSGDWEYVKADIAAVAETLKPAGIPLKVIFETSTLSLEQITRATEICVEAGADFVKTSTGFNGEGATEDGVKAMLAAANGKIKVKPSGGIRDAERAQLFVDMGVHRLGVGYSSTPAICDGTIAATTPGTY